MAFVHGKSTVIKIDNSAGTPVDLSQYVSKTTFGREVDTAEVTTFGKNSKAFIAGLKDGSPSLEGPWDAAVESHMQAILGFETVTLDYQPEGGTTGKRRILAEAILTSYEVDSDIGEANTWSADFQVTGDVTVGTVP